jgi:hypothetical protein
LKQSLQTKAHSTKHQTKKQKKSTRFEALGEEVETQDCSSPSISVSETNRIARFSSSMALKFAKREETKDEEQQAAGASTFV